MTVLIFLTSVSVTFSGHVPEECNQDHRQYDTQKEYHIERTCIIENKN